jgi:hypothetical protein
MSAFGGKAHRWKMSADKHRPLRNVSFWTRWAKKAPTYNDLYPGAILSSHFARLGEGKHGLASGPSEAANRREP